jgi:hypothetical protein
MATIKVPVKAQPEIHKIQELPIIHKKYIIEAFAIILLVWDQNQYPGVNLCASIMNEDGTPVTNLKKDNFRVDYFDQSTGVWRHSPILQWRSPGHRLSAPAADPVC